MYIFILSVVRFKPIRAHSAYDAKLVDSKIRLVSKVSQSICQRITIWILLFLQTVQLPSFQVTFPQLVYSSADIFPQ